MQEFNISADVLKDGATDFVKHQNWHNWRGVFAINFINRFSHFMGDFHGDSRDFQVEIEDNVSQNIHWIFGNFLSKG